MPRKILTDTERKEADKLQAQRYHKANKEKLNERKRQYYHANKDKMKADNKVWRTENKEHIREYQNKYEKTRKQIDPLFALTTSIRSLIRRSFNRTNYRKNTKTEQILGCTFQEFKEHLESQFEPWMRWDNRGLYNGTPNYGWDIDHIIPVSSTATNEDIVRLNHYTNLKPLCGYINRDVKRDLLDYPI